MKGEWCYFESWFTKHQCEDIINKAKNLKTLEVARTGLEKEGSMDGIRRSKVAWINERDEGLTWYFQEIDRLARWANKDWFDFHLTQLPSLQFTEYDSIYKGAYGRHKDVFWVNDQPTHRKLSVVVNLTDPSQYEGGDFKMHEVVTCPQADILKRQGTIFFFPSFIDHEVTPVTSGIRHSLVGWYEGPKWR